jgi:aspartyl-tRNA(Asn)/glutamyl-tRNA(Gln) amidotransferase subunit A
MSDPTRLSIAQAGRAIRAKEVSPSELTEAYLARIERLNPLINAYVTVTAERARADANAATEAFAAGIDLGPLHGIPIALKDLYETAGIRTTAGSKIFADFVPGDDCPAATKLREAGSILLGKTNTHEFAWGSTTNNPHWGATHNPWKTDRIPGGSSGGSGAAIAACMAAGTLGTDTGGSIRMPAAACGCVGLKPTYGRVSKRGVFPMSFLYDHAGPITQTVEDAALMLQAIAGYDALDPNSARVPVDDYTANIGGGARGLRVGILQGLFAEGVDAQILASVREAAHVFQELGAAVEDVDPGFDRSHTQVGFRAVFAETHSIHGDNWASRPQDFGWDLQGILQVPLPDARGVADSIAAASFIRAACQGLLEQYDVLLAPTMPITAPPIGAETVTLNGKPVATGGLLASLTMPLNLARLPVLALPSGFSDEELPMSISLVGRPFDEALVLRAGHAYERATDIRANRYADAMAQSTGGSRNAPQEPFATR